jgi:hypothetical protein
VAVALLGAIAGETVELLTGVMVTILLLLLLLRSPEIGVWPVNFRLEGGDPGPETIEARLLEP